MKRVVVLAAIAFMIGMIAAKTVRMPAPPPHLVVDPARLFANGYDTATLLYSPSSPTPPRFSIDNPHGAAIGAISRTANGWRARLGAGVMPGMYVVRAGQARATVILEPDNTDSIGDGTPDYLRLDDPRDQQAFRRWFTFLAESQYFQAPEARPAEIDDCAALIRYAYREALRAHDSAWATAAHLPLTPAFEPVAKYQYPYTAIGADLFRVPGGFAQFADAQTLQRLNTHFISRDLLRALPGDVIFYRQDVDQMPYHSMIFVGQSHFVRDAQRYVVYHTGPEQGQPGSYKRLTQEELLHYPEQDWRPIASNPYFLGVYRWNILRSMP